MNYLAMRQDFIALLNRSDCTDASSTLVKGWFDKSIARIQREVRAPSMEETYAVDTSGGDVTTVPVPSDWLETKAFVLELSNGDSDELDFMQLGPFYRRRSVNRGRPTHYTRKASDFLIADELPQNCTAELIYYKELDPLVDDDDEPVLAAIAPDLIIYGALTYSSDYFTDSRAQTWEEKWQFFREQIQSQATEGESQTGSNTVVPAYDFDDGVC